MDALSGLLDGPRARGAFLLRAVMDPPWSIRAQDESPLTVLAMVRGDAWVFSRRGEGHVDAAYATAGAVHLARTMRTPVGRPRLIVAQ